MARSLSVVVALAFLPACLHRAPEPGPSTGATPPRAEQRREARPPPMPDRGTGAAPREPARVAQDFSRVPDGSHPDLVGVAVPLSGKYAKWGEAILEGVALALDGSPARLVAKDTRGEPDGAAEALAQLKAEGVIGALGGVTAAEAQRAAEAAQQLGLPFVSLARAEGIPQVGPFVFRHMLTADAQARALAELAMARRGAKRVALLWPTNPYGQELAMAFWDEVEARGGEVTGAEPYDPERTNFAPLVKSLVGKQHLDERADYVAAAKEIGEQQKDPFRRRKAMEKLRATLPPVTDFDAVFVPDFARSVALVAPALAVEDVFTATCDAKEVERARKVTGRADLKPVQLLGSNGWDDPSLVEKAGRYVQCSVFVDGFFAGSDRPATKRFVEAFQARHQHPPSILEASAHDAALALRTAVQGGAVSREGLRAAMSGLRDVPGATGTFSFDERREVSKPLFFLTVDGATIRELRPEELAAPGAG